MKILIEFDTMQQAQAAHAAAFGHQPASPPPQQAQAPYQPPAQQPPAQQQYAPPAQTQYAPPAGAPVQQPPAPQGAAPGSITLAQLTQAAQAYAKAHTPKAAMGVLSQFGITKVSDARPDMYPQLLQALAVA